MLSLGLFLWQRYYLSNRKGNISSVSVRQLMLFILLSLFSTTEKRAMTSNQPNQIAQSQSIGEGEGAGIEAVVEVEMLVGNAHMNGRHGTLNDAYLGL